MVRVELDAAHVGLGQRQREFGPLLGPGIVARELVNRVKRHPDEDVRSNLVSRTRQLSAMNRQPAALRHVRFRRSGRLLLRETAVRFDDRGRGKMTLVGH